MAKRYDAIARGNAIPDGVEPLPERVSRLRELLETFECVQETKFVEDGHREDPEVIATVVEGDDMAGTTNRELWDDLERSDLLDLWVNHSATYTRRAGDDTPPEGTRYKGYSLVEPLDEQNPDAFPKDDLRPTQDRILFRTPRFTNDQISGVGTWGTLSRTEFHADEDTVLVEDPGEHVSPVVEWDDVIAVARGHTANVILRGPAFDDVDEGMVERRHERLYG